GLFAQGATVAGADDKARCLAVLHLPLFQPIELFIESAVMAGRPRPVGAAGQLQLQDAQFDADLHHRAFVVHRHEADIELAMLKRPILQKWGDIRIHDEWRRTTMDGRWNQGGQWPIRLTVSAGWGSILCFIADS